MLYIVTASSLHKFLELSIFPGVQLVPHQLEKVRNLILSLLCLRNLTNKLRGEPADPDSFALKSQLCYLMVENQLNVSVLSKSYKLVLFWLSMSPCFSCHVENQK
jgi:hypothetical protein